MFVDGGESLGFSDGEERNTQLCTADNKGLDRRAYYNSLPEQFEERRAHY